MVVDALAPQGYAFSRKTEAAIRKTPSYNPDMEYRRLGKTNLLVSAVYLGGHWKRVNIWRLVIPTADKANVPPARGLDQNLQGLPRVLYSVRPSERF